MPVYAPPQRLQRVSTAEHWLLDAWAEGVSLESDTGLSINELRRRAAVDRWWLAHDFRRRGRKMVGQAPPQHRDAVSRFYYSMYHAFRAIVFIEFGGDDHEAHSTLQKSIPQNFPSRQQWSNRLKNARLDRNSADYDPYPKSETAWRSASQRLSADADELLSVTKTYLIATGCSGL